MMMNKLTTLNKKLNSSKLVDKEKKMNLLIYRNILIVRLISGYSYTSSTSEVHVWNIDVLLFIKHVLVENEPIIFHYYNLSYYSPSSTVGEFCRSRALAATYVFLLLLIIIIIIVLISSNSKWSKHVNEIAVRENSV